MASLGVSVAFVDATIVNIAFPDIEKSFSGTSISTLSWILNAYNIVFAAFLVAAGRLADLLGRRRMFLLGLQIFTVASLLCAIAPSSGALTGFRVLQALGAALLVPASLGLVLNAFPPDRRSHGVALLSAVAAAAAGLGPSLGGLLVSAANWRLVFLVNVPIGIAAMLLARRHLIESRSPGFRRMPDVLGALIFALAIGTLVLGIVQGENWGWTSPEILGAFLASIVLFVSFGWRCTWHRAPIVDLALLRIRPFTVTNAMTIVAAAGFYGYTLTNVLFLTGVWHYSVLEAGLALTPGPFVAAAVAGPASALAGRIGHRPVLIAGGLMWGAAVLWFVLRVGVTPAFWSQWLPGMVFLGIGAGVLFPNLSGAAVAAAPGDSFATATALNAVTRQLGAALGVALVIAIIGTPTPPEAAAAFDHAWTFAAVCLGVAGLGCLFTGRLGAADDVRRTPSLAAATRVALSRDDDEPAVAGVRVSPRRPPAIDGALELPARPETIAEFLANVPLFEALSPELHELLAGQSAPLRLEAGEWLFREGDRGDTLFVVRTGRLEVVTEGRQEMVLGEFGRGAALGELAVLTGQPRSASVRATRDSDLIAIEREHFDHVLNAEPAVSRALTRTLAARLSETRGQAPTGRPLPATVTLVALDDRAPTRELAEGLAAALTVHGRAVLLRGDEVAPPLPGMTPAVAYGPLLDRCEGEYDVVLLLGGQALSDEPWTAFCLQQADRILALTAGGTVPEAARRRAEQLRGCDLVSWDVREGSGALEEWASLLEPLEAHALRRASLHGDLARTARRLTGRSVGVVLSGGGARAFSHVGVLEELMAAGVTIDRVAGVSMGAYVGALFAMGMDGDEMDARCFDEWVRRRPLGDYTVPRHAFIRGERAEGMLRRTFGTLAIEDLNRSFFCACAELRSAELVVARSGPLWEAVGFSMCIPILAPPQVRGRNLFVDGSLLDNLPVRTMADLGEGPVIAVDVRASFERKPGGTRPTDAMPRETRAPTIGETLTRVLLLASANTSESASRHADFVIQPRNEGVGLLEFHQIDAAREAGRVAAREALERAPAVLFG